MDTPAAVPMDISMNIPMGVSIGVSMGKSMEVFIDTCSGGSRPTQWEGLGGVSSPRQRSEVLPI